MLLHEFYIKILNVLSSLDTTSKIILTSGSMDIFYNTEDDNREMLRFIIKENNNIAISLFETSWGYRSCCIAHHELLNNDINNDDFLANTIKNSFNMIFNLKNLL